MQHPDGLLPPQKACPSEGGSALSWRHDADAADTNFSHAEPLGQTRLLHVRQSVPSGHPHRHCPLHRRALDGQASFALVSRHAERHRCGQGPRASAPEPRRSIPAGLGHERSRNAPLGELGGQACTQLTKLCSQAWNCGCA